MAIDMVSGMMGIDGQPDSPISDWQVWFMTPFGLIKLREDAVRRVQEANCDLDPRLVIIPVPIALDANGRYEVVSR